MAQNILKMSFGLLSKKTFKNTFYLSFFSNQSDLWVVIMSKHLQLISHFALSSKSSKKTQELKSWTSIIEGYNPDLITASDKNWKKNLAFNVDKVKQQFKFK